jgi:hypothetical protein
MADGSPLGGSFVSGDKANPMPSMYPHVGKSKYKG